MLKLGRYRQQRESQARACTAFPARRRRNAERRPDVRAIYAQKIGRRPGSEAADRLLRYALHQVCPDAPVPLLRAKMKNGKPFLPEYPGFHFSLAHSGAWAVCAVSEYPLGVDIEQVRELRRGIAERFFSPEECALLEGGGDAAFFALWTLKEAAVKASGEGLARGLSHARVTMAETPVIELEHFRAFPLPFADKNYRLSLCLSRADLDWTNAELQVMMLE